MGYGEIGFSGVLPRDGAAAEEIAALVVELRSLGWLLQADKSEIRKLIKA